MDSSDLICARHDESVHHARAGTSVTAGEGRLIQISASDSGGPALRPGQPSLPEELSALVNPRNTALVIVGLQNDQCTPQEAQAQVGADVSALRPVLERTRQLLRVARGSGVLVVWVPHPFRKTGPLSETEPPAHSDGTRGANLAEPLLPMPHEPVIERTGSSGFVGTGLDRILNVNGIRTCVIVGADTEDAVQSTILSAVFHHYTPIIPEDCVGSLHSELHTESLRVLRNSYDMTTSSRLIDWWQKSNESRMGTRGPSGEQKLDALVHPDHSALIVVDVQNDFCSPLGDYDKRGVDITEARAIVPTTKNLVDAARDAGVLVVWLRASFLPHGLSDSAATRRFISRHHDRPYCVVGTWGHGVADGLRPEPGDIVIDKFRADGFVGTPLHMFLNSNGVRTVILGGVVTQGCVDATARGAADHGYQVVCVEDAMAATTFELHAAGVAMMRYLFRVVQSEALLRSWASGVTADQL